MEESEMKETRGEKQQKRMHLGRLGGAISGKRKNKRREREKRCQSKLRAPFQCFGASACLQHSSSVLSFIPFCFFTCCQSSQELHMGCGASTINERFDLDMTTRVQVNYTFTDGQTANVKCFLSRVPIWRCDRSSGVRSSHTPNEVGVFAIKQHRSCLCSW